VRIKVKKSKKYKVNNGI
jgi:lariat debranching enzyme